MSDVRIRSTIRGRRQITLPRNLCETLGIAVGDSVDMQVEAGTLVITPSRRRAKAALDAIREAFAKSGITEEELLDAARRARQKRVQERGAARKTA